MTSKIITSSGEKTETSPCGRGVIIYRKHEVEYVIDGVAVTQRVKGNADILQQIISIIDGKPTKSIFKEFDRERMRDFYRQGKK